MIKEKPKESVVEAGPINFYTKNSLLEVFEIYFSHYLWILHAPLHMSIAMQPQK